MGCDIHIYTEANLSVGDVDKWVNVDNWRVNRYFGLFEYENCPYLCEHIYSSRDYDLFSFLAGVRNYGHNESFGFDRGLPEDIAPQTQAESDSWGTDGHSHGYCTLEELKSAVKSISKVRHEGAVSKDQVKRFRETGETPNSWCQGVGTFIGIAPDFQDAYEWLVWEDEVHCFDSLLEAIEERKRDVFWIFDKEDDDFSHDKDIRIVFWFDS